MIGESLGYRLRLTRLQRSPVFKGQPARRTPRRQIRGGEILR